MKSIVLCVLWLAMSIVALGVEYDSYLSKDIGKRFGRPDDHEGVKDGWPKKAVISKDYRTWTNSRGVKVEAAWSHVSQDGETIWLTYREKGKYVKIKVGQLSSSDIQYVQSYIKKKNDDGWVWWRGVYISRDMRQEYDWYFHALNFIDEKTLSGCKTLKVFQAWDMGGLCDYGHMDRGLFVRESPNLVYWQVGERGTLANGDLLRDKRMYWAGTIKYEMVKGGVNTVSCYTDDLRFAIRLVRIRMKLYKPGDSRFTEDVRPPPVVTPPQGGNLNPVKVSLLCTGSGFFVTANGYLLTNNHVVQGGKSYKVLMSDGLAEANLVKTDPETDLALLKVEKKVAACAFSSNRKERLGNDIFTLGFPQPDLQGFSPKVTKGVISGVDGFQGNVHGNVRGKCSGK